MDHRTDNGSGHGGANVRDAAASITLPVDETTKQPAASDGTATRPARNGGAHVDRLGRNTHTAGEDDHRMIDTLRIFASSEPGEIRTTRKRKLLALFQSFDSARMDKLADSTKAPTLSQMVKSPRKTAKPFAPSDLAAAVGLFPAPRPTPASADKKAPRAMTLRQLEQETLSILQSSNIQSPRRSLRPFSLKFQEASILGVARYISLKTNSSGKVGRRYTRACVDGNFRRCSICRKWGHYETQCLHIQPLEAYRLLPPNERLTDAREEPKANTSRQMGDVSVEQCDGFLIEQRAVPRIENSNDPTAQSETLDTVCGGFRIKASSSRLRRASPFAAKVGDVVAWNLAPECVANGIVEHVDSLQDLLQVRCLGMARGNASSSESPGPFGAMVGARVSVPMKSARRAERAVPMAARHES
jgi:hypothetical protein